jgi:uncharacterized membrane protein YqiK
MSTTLLMVGILLAVAICSGAFQVRDFRLRLAATALAATVLLLFFTLASFRYVDEGSIGIINKKIGFRSLPPGKIIATEGEKGYQAEILPPGWHPWYWPFVYDIDIDQITNVPLGKVAVLKAQDGQPLPHDTPYAPEWNEADASRMSQDARYFLTQGKGFKGPQTTVLTPGAYRINPKLFEVELVPATTVERASVGVVKSNVGARRAGIANLDPESNEAKVVDRGERGIWREPLLPGQYYLNTQAYEVTPISTQRHIVRYTAVRSREAADDQGISAEESAIRVRTTDGFTFPVDVRVEYEIFPQDAPLLVANVGDDKEGLSAVLNSAVRAIFRNNAEGVKALDYVQQRSQQEAESLRMLQEEMGKIGVTISAVRIGDVGDEETLGELLKTQTDREIALQEQETFQEQQRAAEQKKQLSRATQETSEEMRLATAKYDVQIAEQNREKQIITAEAEAESVKIRAEAQANAYALIAKQIGKGNAALVETLKIVGENDIAITPRVMVVGGAERSAADGATVALVGTLLESMIAKEEQESPAPAEGQP